MGRVGYPEAEVSIDDDPVTAPVLLDTVKVSVRVLVLVPGVSALLAELEGG